MYSTIETPLTTSTEQNHNNNKFQYQQYHLNAFTNPPHSTAKAITASSSSLSSASLGEVKNGDNAKSIIITTSSSSESHTTQPSTLFTHDNRNKFSYGAYINNATISNNNNNETNDKKSFNTNRTTTMVNDKM